MKTVRGDFFEIKLLVQPAGVFDSESHDSNFTSLAPPGGEKKIIFKFFLQNDVTSRRGRFCTFFRSNESFKKVLKFYFLI